MIKIVSATFRTYILTNAGSEVDAEFVINGRDQEIRKTRLRAGDQKESTVKTTMCSIEATDLWPFQDSEDKFQNPHHSICWSLGYEIARILLIDSKLLRLGMQEVLSIPLPLEAASLSPMKVYVHQVTDFFDTLAFPTYAGCVSLVVFLLQLLYMSLWRNRSARKSAPEDISTNSADSDTVFPEEETTEVDTQSRIARHDTPQGGSTIFAFNFGKLVACAVLLTLSLISWVVSLSDDDSSAFGLSQTWVLGGLCLTHAYVLILSFVPLLAKPAWGSIASGHATLVLLCTFAVYLYRDVWPYATFTQKPLDTSEGVMLWVKIADLIVAALIIPLLAPRIYEPFDAKVEIPNSINPWPHPHPEQTAPIPSLMLFSWLDKLVMKAYRMPHLPVDELPPLADTDSAGNLVKRAFKVFSQFASPVAIKYLLAYVESGGADADVRPWVWITWLFIGPMAGVIVSSLYYMASMRVAVQLEVVVTELVFTHALRIRMKAETSEDAPTAPVTPDNASIVRSSAAQSEDEATVREEETFADSTTASTQSAKAKQKSKSTPEQAVVLTQPTADETKDKDKGKSLVGKINNLITSDLANITKGVEYAQIFVRIPVQLVLCVWFLYTILGWSATPCSWNAYENATRNTNYTIEEGVIRMVKLFGWESHLMRQISKKREDELAWLRQSRLLNLFNSMVGYFIPLSTMMITYWTYMGVALSMRTSQIHVCFGLLPEFIQGITELLDDFSENTSPNPDERRIHSSATDLDVIGFRDATFTWANEEQAPPDGRSWQRFMLRIENELTFKQGCINLIVGPTGSGKTSMLMALLGTMAPESRIRNEELNMAMLSELMRRISKTSCLVQRTTKHGTTKCGLKRDWELFDAGDMTEVGERGITLSGGQKVIHLGTPDARVTLARAVYSTAEILLLDDILAALDVHTARWIVEKYLKGDLIRGRTVLLVTHNIAMASPVSQFVVSLGVDGRVLSQGSLSSALAHDKTLAAETEKDRQAIEKVEIHAIAEDVYESAKKASGKLILEEEIAEGHVGWSAVKLYLTNLGGRHQIVLWIGCLGALFVSECIETSQVWYLGYWARQYEEHPANEVKVSLYLFGYATLLLVSLAFYASHYTVYTFGSIRASKIIHNSLFACVLGTTLRVLGNIMNTSDAMIVKLAVVVLMSPFFLIPGVFIVALVALGGWIGQLYMKVQLSVKREKSTAQAPVLGLFGAAFAGLALAAYLVYFNKGLENRVLIEHGRGSANSLERIKQYMDIEQEPKSTDSGVPPAYWPSSGDLKVENPSARYSPKWQDGPLVLQDISFEVKSGERVGIVGRTGSGKSSLTLALLRCIVTEGKVYYDGLPTDNLNLEALRSRITVIPQMPELLSGTLRQNLDPFEDYDDAVLNDALRSAGLFILQQDMDEGRITLDTQISSGGSNLSVGQRQILALARAIVRQSKLLILDEDYDTDAVIQESLRKELENGVTVLTVAHRLQTIMDADKIMVLDAGRIVEYGKPSELLKNENGHLHALVKESGDVEKLYAMAAGAGAST
ncbi:predicted protein [Postia placenta Mad-698-R]|nr:predicted protein [Postia placenta Mad-698-R]